MAAVEITPPALAPSRRAELARFFADAIREMNLRARLEWAQASGDEAAVENISAELQALTSPARRWRF